MSTIRISEIFLVVSGKILEIIRLSREGPPIT